MGQDFKKCRKCELVVQSTVLKCPDCGFRGFRTTAVDPEGNEIISEAQISEKAHSVRCFTADAPSTVSIAEELGLVIGVGSKVGVLGPMFTQADRMASAYSEAIVRLKIEASALGANAVIAIRVSANNVPGGAGIGSSDAIVLVGTAVIIN